jgi:hypothetical protein
MSIFFLNLYHGENKLKFDENEDDDDDDDDDVVLGYSRKIQTLFVRTLETGRKVSLFRSERKLIYYLPIMYVYCVYPAMSKSPKQTAKLSEKNRNKRRSNRFQGCPLRSRCLYCYHISLSVYMNRVTKKLFHFND